VLWLGIGLALAGEPVTEESTYNRLFQEGSPPSGETAPLDEPGVSIGSWIIPILMLVGAGTFLLWQRQKLGNLPQSTLRVLHRQPIGDRTSVVLLEVPDQDGEVRRLLIGTSPGAPVLLADLGFSETASPPTARPESTRPLESKPAAPKVELPKASPPKPTSPMRADPARTEPPRTPMRSPGGGNIAQEILAERVKVRPQDNFREEGDYDDPDDADPPPPDDDDSPPSPPSPPNRGFSRLLARIGD